MDEYIGLSSDAPETFGNFVSRGLYSKRDFHAVEFLSSDSENPEEEAER
ncbi:MAG: hypothetical protein RBR15_15335 [Sphaerochaeta sp.]|nr:hypothetical protein [Sphaerochaeta sp.]